MRDRSPIFVALADLLLCVLSVVIVAVAPKTPVQAGVREKAEYLIRSEWSVDIDADVDIWLVTPSKKPVFYMSRDVGCARLDSDSRGFLDDVIKLADGSTVKVDSDVETIQLRCIEPGHYELGVHLYAYRRNGSTVGSEAGFGLPVHVWVEGLNPITRVVFDKHVKLDRIGQAVNVTGFDLSSDGKITLTDPQLEPITNSYYKGHAPGFGAPPPGGQP